jgi:hypothetical protein
MEDAVASDEPTGPRQVVVDERRCSRCRAWKPLTDFHRRSGGGYRSECKACRSAARRARPVTPPGTKRCPSCEQTKPHSCFYERPDGSRHSWCVDCESAQKQAKRAEEAKLREEKAEAVAASVLQAGEKACTRCDTMLPLDSFAPNPRRRDGREARCRVCSRLRSSELDPEDRGRAQEWEMRSRVRKERFRELAAKGRPGEPGVSEDELWDESGKASTGHPPPDLPE